MRRLIFLAAPLAALALPATTGAQGPGAGISLESDAYLITFNTQDVHLGGRLSGVARLGNQRVRLRGSTAPFTRFGNGRTTRTAADGTFSFTVRPTQNVHYQVVAATRPALISPQVNVFVARRVTIKVSSGRPRAGGRLRISGYAYPPADGAAVDLQYLRGANWRTVQRRRLFDVGPTRSGYRFIVSAPRRRTRLRVITPETRRFVSSASNQRTVRPR